MRISSFKYYVAEAIRGIFRNRVMSLSSCATVAACMFIVILSYCVAINIDATLKAQESGIAVMVYIDDEISSDQVNELYNHIIELKHVTGANYITKEQAMQDFMDSSEDPDLVRSLELLPFNPLRRSFEVSVDEASNAAAVAEALQTPEMVRGGVAKVRNHGAFIGMLTSISNIVRIVSIVIILCLGVLSVVIITNTIKLTINSRRNEISIMKYIGSTDWFIRWPFVLEGLFLGVAGAFFPLVLCFIFYDSVVSAIMSDDALFDMVLKMLSRSEVFPFLIPIVILLGGAVGMAGSLSTIRKYLDV